PPAVAVPFEDRQRSIVQLDVPPCLDSHPQQPARGNAQAATVRDQTERPVCLLGIAEDLVQQRSEAFGGRIQGLTARRRLPRRGTSPLRVALGVVHLQLGMRTTLPLALAELDEATVGLDTHI